MDRCVDVRGTEERRCNPVGPLSTVGPLYLHVISLEGAIPATVDLLTCALSIPVETRPTAVGGGECSRTVPCQGWLLEGARLEYRAKQQGREQPACRVLAEGQYLREGELRAGDPPELTEARKRGAEDERDEDDVGEQRR